MAGVAVLGPALHPRDQLVEGRGLGLEFQVLPALVVRGEQRGDMAVNANDALGARETIRCVGALLAEHVYFQHEFVVALEADERRCFVLGGQPALVTVGGALDLADDAGPSRVAGHPTEQVNAMAAVVEHPAAGAPEE